MLARKIIGAKKYAKRCGVIERRVSNLHTRNDVHYKQDAITKIYLEFSKSNIQIVVTKYSCGTVFQFNLPREYIRMFQKMVLPIKSLKRKR